MLLTKILLAQHMTILYVVYMLMSLKVILQSRMLYKSLLCQSNIMSPGELQYVEGQNGVDESLTK